MLSATNGQKALNIRIFTCLEIHFTLILYITEKRKSRDEKVKMELFLKNFLGLCDEEYRNSYLLYIELC